MGEFVEKDLNVSFDSFQILNNLVLKKINKRKKYTGIVCVLKGGFYLSYFLSKYLNLPLFYIETSSYDSLRNRVTPTIKHHNLPLTGRFILCDDIYDSGETFKKIFSEFSFLQFDPVVLITKKNLPNLIYGMKISKQTWVNFWWEKL